MSLKYEPASEPLHISVSQPINLVWQVLGFFAAKNAAERALDDPLRKSPPITLGNEGSSLNPPERGGERDRVREMEE